MKKEFFIGLVVQGAVAALGCGFGAYGAIAVSENDISWIEKIQQNHEMRIEALEARAEVARATGDASHVRVVRGQAPAHQFLKQLALERPGVERADRPFNALGRIESMAHEPPAGPLIGDQGEIPPLPPD